MPALNDYVCKCGKEWMNELEVPTCDCGATPEVTFAYWKSLSQTRDFKGENDLVDDQGFRRKFKASEDPTALREVGFLPADGIQTFSPEQAHYYANRMLREDSPSLRKEILRERAKNLQQRGVTTPESM